MHVIFNILILGLVGLIAYWWANQGLFSAILHLLCVITAGVITLAFWEPIVVGYLLKDSWFDKYAWGVTFLVLFTVMLGLLRITLDKTVRANVNIPHWANLVFGFPVGAAAGVLTIGMFVIGMGFIQSNQKIMGFSGYGRDKQGAVVRLDPSMWLPVHYWTAEFFSMLSVTSLETSKPLRHYYPELYKQGFLLRDSYGAGKGQFHMLPEAVNIRNLVYSKDVGRCTIVMQFKSTAMDYGKQLTLSSSQIRLIGTARNQKSPEVAHPIRWIQKTAENPAGKLYEFDDPSHYITSISGKESADIILEFKWSGANRPAFVQIRGTRFKLPRKDPVGNLEYSEIFRNASLNTGGRSSPAGSGGVPIAEADIFVNNRVPGLEINKNRVSGTMTLEGNDLSSGEMDVVGRSTGIVGKALRVNKIAQPTGTKVILVNISRGNSSVDLYNLRPRLTASDELQIVDDSGDTYSPIGFIQDKGNKIFIKLQPGRRIRRFDELPALPSSGTHKLWLVFRVTEGVTIVRFEAGNRTIGTCNIKTIGR